MNYKLFIQFDGTDLHGWQIQPNAVTIQEEFEKVLSLLEGAPVKISGCGRTDAGVHADGYIASVKMNREFSCENLRNAINGNLRRDIRVMNVENADEDFHARFSAKGKTYVYRVINAPVMPPRWLRFALHEKRELDLSAMENALKLFVGKHDWTAFSAAQTDVKDRIRTVNDFSMERSFDERACGDLFEFRISGEGFLRYMVRSVVGTILEVGRGEMQPEQILRALETCDRSLAGRTAPAHGLTLEKVFY